MCVVRVVYLIKGLSLQNIMRQAEGLITVTIGRFGSEPQEVKIDADSTVVAALAEVGISLGSSDKVWVNGVRAQNRDILEEGDIVNVVTPKQAGSDVTTA